MILENLIHSIWSRYGWRTTEWTECRVDPLLSQQDKRRGNQTALCGGGIQTREMYCVQANENLLSYLNTLKEKEGKFDLLANSISLKSEHFSIPLLLDSRCLLSRVPCYITGYRNPSLNKQANKKTTTGLVGMEIFNCRIRDFFMLQILVPSYELLFLNFYWKILSYEDISQLENKWEWRSEILDLVPSSTAVLLCVLELHG